MMKPIVFSHLSLTSQSSHLWQDGELLFVRKTGIFEIRLYSVFHFLVEVIFINTTGTVETIRIMDPHDALEDYAHFIELPLD